MKSPIPRYRSTERGRADFHGVVAVAVHTVAADAAAQVACMDHDGARENYEGCSRARRE
jgi:hypothetical protein